MKNNLAYLFFILLFSACSNNEKSNEIPSPLFPKAQSFEANPPGGYSSNVITGKKIEPIINGNGEILITGANYTIKADTHFIDSLNLPIPILVPSNSKLTKINAYPNVIPISEKLEEIPVFEDSLTKYYLKNTISQDKQNYIINSFGDSVFSGIKTPIKGTKESFVQPKITKALPFQFKDNATKDIRYLNVDQGLSMSYILSVLEDKNGNIWLATFGGGVSKYDGNNFVHYTEENGLSNNFVYSILEDKEGNMWFATQKGVSKFNGEYFINYTEKEGLNENWVLTLFEDKKGNIWFGTSGGGICKFDGESFIHFTVNEGLVGNKVWVITEDSVNNIWIGTSSGISKFNGDSFVNFTIQDGLCNNRIKSILHSEIGEIWIGTENGVSHYNGKVFTNFKNENGLGNKITHSILEDKDGDIWFGTYGDGVFKYDGKSITNYTEDDGLNSNYIWSIFEDKNNNIWFGTYGGGISIYNKNSFVHFTKKEGLSSNVIYSILEDKNNHLWFASAIKGASKFDGKTFTHYTKNEGLASNILYSMAEDKKGNIWFATASGGLTKFDGKSFINYSIKEGLVTNLSLAILEDSKGNIWIGNYKAGILKFDGKSFIRYTHTNGLNSKFIYSITEDSKGNIWFGTADGGASKFDGKSFFNFTEKEGLASNAVWAIHEDSDNNIWLGTECGLTKYDGSSFTHYTEKEGISNNVIHSILEDKNKNLWISTGNGISKLIFDNENKSKELISINSFSKQDGLKALDFWATSGLIDSDENIWWGSGKSLVKLDLKKQNSSKNLPKVNLNQLVVNDQLVDFRKYKDSLVNGISYKEVQKFENYPISPSFSFDKNHLTFSFNAINWSAPHKVKYSFMMEGMNSNWSPAKHESKADYRNLSHGNYTFKVKAINENGVWGKPFEYNFTIHPPWWHTWWARSLYALLFIFSVLKYFSWRTASLKKRQKELEVEITEATTEIRAQKEEAEILRAKAEKSEQFKQQFLANMSHEIRTPMNAVMGMTSLLLDKKPREDQFNYLDGIKKSSDNLLHIINDILDLSKIESNKMELEEIDFSIKSSLNHVIEILNHKAAEKGLEILSNISSDVNDIVKGDPVRLNQILINLTGNAIKFTDTGSVSIVVNNEKKGLKFSVIDTGIGIPKDKLQKVFESFSQANASDTRKYGGTGLGLSISQQLVSLMGGEIIVESKEGSGTTFSFIVNLAKGSKENMEARLALEKDVDGSILDGLTILITDDNEYNRIVAKDTLKSKANVIIHEAENGREAIKMVEKTKYDVILMDIQMPNMNGYDTTRYIRANFESPIKETPIIALTASVLRVDLDKCKESGMDSYIPKPFKTQQLITGIAQVLDIQLKRETGIEKSKSSDSNQIEKIETKKEVIRKITDMNYLSDFCEGNTDKMKKYIGLYTKSAPGLIERINHDYNNDLYEDIANQVHGFKTKFIMMGMTSTKNLAIELEKQCRELSDFEGIKTNVYQLIENMKLSLSELMD